MPYRNNLARLKQKLLDHDSRMDALVDQTRVDEAARLSKCMPLSHGTASKNFLTILQSGKLLTHAEKFRHAPATDTDEVLLGTQDYVFFYAAPFSYPKSTCGFLFKTALEEHHRDGGEATPFDSGGLNKHLKASLNLEERRDFLEAHKLPVPGYRSYLELLLLHCFDTPWHYVAGEAPVILPPVELDQHSNDRSWLMEIRIPGNVPIKTHLMAVWVPIEDFVHDAVVDFQLFCDQRGIDIEPIETGMGSFDELQQLSRSYIRTLQGGPL